MKKKKKDRKYGDEKAKNDHVLVLFFWGEKWRYFFTLSPVWLVLCWDDAGTVNEQMPLISCHYSSVASHKHIPASSHERSNVQRYLLPVMMRECVWLRVINREIKDKMGQGDWGCMTEKDRKKTMWGGIQPELSHFLSVHWDTNSGWMSPSGRSGRQDPRKTGPED